MREMVDKPEYIALINPVSGFPDDKQRVMLARFEPTDWFVIGKDGNLEDYAKMMRAPRVALVAVPAMLAENKGSKLDRTDSLVTTKTAIHKRGRWVVDANGRDSRKNWAAMKRDGCEICRRLAQGRKSIFNGRKGTPPLAERYSDNDLRDLMRVKESVKYKNWRTRRAAMKKLGIDPIPGRTWFLYQLENVARSRGLLD
jgi:hypothetical protein